MKHIVIFLLGLTLKGCAVIPSPEPVFVPPMKSTSSFGENLFTASAVTLGSAVRVRIQDDVAFNHKENDNSSKTYGLSMKNSIDLPFVPDMLGQQNISGQGSYTQKSSHDMSLNRTYQREVSGLITDDNGTMVRVEVSNFSYIKEEARRIRWSGWFNKTDVINGGILESSKAVNVHLIEM